MAGAKQISEKQVRRSVTLPSVVANQIAGMAKQRRLSDNRLLVELIEQGIEARKQKEKAFFSLAERFRAATNPEEVKRLGDELGRFVFGEWWPRSKPVPTAGRRSQPFGRAHARPKYQSGRSKSPTALDRIECTWGSVAYSDDVNGRFQRDVNGHSGDVNKVGAQRRWDYNHARYLRD